MRQKWTKEKLIHELKWLAEQKSNILHLNLFEIFSNLDEHVHEIFGSWKQAAEEANVDFAIFKKILEAVSQIWVPTVTTSEKTMKKNEILETIRTLVSLQESLPTNTILKIITKVESSAKEIFGSWNEAVREAGVSKEDLPDIDGLKHTLDLLNQSSLLDSLATSISKKEETTEINEKRPSKLEERGIACPNCAHVSTFSDAIYCGICATKL